jgi:hypothetical protein
LEHRASNPVSVKNLTAIETSTIVKLLSPYVPIGTKRTTGQEIDPRVVLWTNSMVITHTDSLKNCGNSKYSEIMLEIFGSTASRNAMMMRNVRLWLLEECIERLNLECSVVHLEPVVVSGRDILGYDTA